MRGRNSEDKRQLRSDLCIAAGGLCAYCRRPTPMRLGTVDHYVPQKLGGTNERSNLRWCCNECNGLKADMTPEQWAQFPGRPRHDPTPASVRTRRQLLQFIANRARALREGRKG